MLSNRCKGELMNVDVANLSAQEKYHLLNGGVTPRPIAWISTRSKAGHHNLAPYSFFTVASCDPPVLVYTQVTQRSGLDKDTFNNLMETGECVVNIANANLVEKVNKSSAGISSTESEFDFAEVAFTDSKYVAPLSVAQSPVRYECTLRETVPISDLPTGGTLILLDVKSVYVKDTIYADGRIDQALIDSIGKMGGDSYSYTKEQVALERP